ncbi:MAG: SDR family oxidoreductase [Chloroflexi bacterium]|nr:SDR family oxidoreductase [Chloroflexota bacterium]
MRQITRIGSLRPPFNSPKTKRSPLPWCTTLKQRLTLGRPLSIGGATARRLAEEGARVLIVDINAEAADRNVAAIRAPGGVADALANDVGTEDGVRGMVDRAISLWGGVDILVNNAYAGVGGRRVDAVGLSEDAWDRSMDVGLKAMFRAVKYAVPHMRQAGGGSIVNLSSVHGLLGAPGSLVYETLKAGVIGLTRQLAVEYGPDGVRVNAICPGHIVTERIAEVWRDHQEALAFFAEQYPVRRTGKPVDIANAVVFLCSDEASFITGQALVVDGGLSIQLQEDLGVRLARYAQEHALPWFPY